MHLGSHLKSVNFLHSSAFYRHRWQAIWVKRCQAFREHGWQSSWRTQIISYRFKDQDNDKLSSFFFFLKKSYQHISLVKLFLQNWRKAKSIDTKKSRISTFLTHMFSKDSIVTWNMTIKTSFKIAERLFNVTVRLITDFQTDSQYRNILNLNAKYFKLAIKIRRN